jgi:hypothetical protein
MENARVACLYPGQIEKSFSPKLTDYFIQGVRNVVPLVKIILIPRQPVFALSP